MNLRNIAFPLVALIVVGGLIYLRPDRDPLEPPTDQPDPAPIDRSFHFVHTLRFTPLPGQVLLRGPIEDRTERWFDRLFWAPNRLVFQTQEQIGGLDEAEQAHFMSLMWQGWKRSPRNMAKHLTCLGAFEIPEAEQLILEATQHTDNLVRGQASRALTMLDSPLAAARAAELLSDTTEMVRRAAIRALTTMDTPEALTALEEYAARGGKDGIRHVLHRLSRNTEDASSIPALRRHLGQDDPGRFMALEGLSRFGDLVAVDEIERMLSSPDVVTQSRGLKMLSLVPTELVDVELLEPYLTHRMPEMRQLVGSILHNLAIDPEPNQPELVQEFLNRQVGDGDMHVRQQALGGLYRAGRKDLAEIYLKGIASSSRLSLHTAVDVTTRIMEEPRAGKILLERLSTETDPTNIAILMVGLGNAAQPEALEPLLGILRQAHPDEPRDGAGTPLSKTAAQQIPRLKVAAHEPLLRILEDDDVHEYAKLRALDTLRGLAVPDVLDDLIEVTLDPNQSPSVRMAALESLPHLNSEQLFEALQNALDEFQEYDLGQRALTILYEYS